MADEQSKTLSVEDAGRLLSISRASAYQAVAAGEIPSIRIGKRLLVPRAKLMALLGEDVAAPAPELVEA